MKLAHRIDHLERVLETRSGPTREEFEAAQRRENWRAWLWMADIVDSVGVAIPAHCVPIVAEARQTLAGDSKATQAQDRDLFWAYAKAHGYAKAKGAQEWFLSKVLDMAHSHQPEKPAQSMAAALALALDGQQVADNGQR